MDLIFVALGQRLACALGLKPCELLGIRVWEGKLEADTREIMRRKPGGSGPKTFSMMNDRGLTSLTARTNSGKRFLSSLMPLPFPPKLNG